MFCQKAIAFYLCPQCLMWHWKCKRFKMDLWKIKNFSSQWQMYFTVPCDFHVIQDPHAMLAATTTLSECLQTAEWMNGWMVFGKSKQWWKGKGSGAEERQNDSQRIPTVMKESSWKTFANKDLGRWIYKYSNSIP